MTTKFLNGGYALTGYKPWRYPQMLTKTRRFQEIWNPKQKFYWSLEREKPVEKARIVFSGIICPRFF